MTPARQALFLILFSVSLSVSPAYSQSAADPCPRPHIGAIVTQPAELYSSNGSLHVELSFRTFTDLQGRRRYCYITGGLAHGQRAEAPTLHVKPGDELVLKLKNDLPASEHQVHLHHDMEIHGPCGGGKLTPSTTNLHFHGLSIPPVCHQDEVMSTLIEPAGTAFEYRFNIPPAQAPGLYWYHPHPHGFSEAQVLGGASGALIVDGIESVKPDVAGLPERILVLRDQAIPGMAQDDADAAGPQPAKDISINFVGVLYPENRPAAMVGKPGQREFWRVLNAAADTYFDLQIRTGASLHEIRDPLPIELVAMDGAPAGGDSVSRRTDVLLPPGARAEFLLTTPAEGVFAQVVTLPYDTGTGGESTPYRVIANFFSSRQAPEAPSRMSAAAASAPPRKFEDLTGIAPSRIRRLYFSETRSNPNDPKSPVDYFITLDGKLPKAFDMNFIKPDITVQQGSVEDWIIENRALESHVFHIHQIHFQVLERDGKMVTEPFLRDTVDLPYWDGKNPRYPSVKLRMDFRDPNIVGTFLFHCHILEHEDGGMMGSIRVTPRAPQRTPK